MLKINNGNEFKKRQKESLDYNVINFNNPIK